MKDEIMKSLRLYIYIPLCLLAINGVQAGEKDDLKDSWHKNLNVWRMPKADLAIEKAWESYFHHEYKACISSLDEKTAVTPETCYLRGRCFSWIGESTKATAEYSHGINLTAKSSKDLFYRGCCKYSLIPFDSHNAKNELDCRKDWIKSIQGGYVPVKGAW